MNHTIIFKSLAIDVENLISGYSRKNKIAAEYDERMHDSAVYERMYDFGAPAGDCKLATAHVYFFHTIMVMMTCEPGLGILFTWQT